MAGTLQTPTVDMADNTILNVSGSLSAGAGTPAQINGSAGSNVSDTACWASSVSTTSNDRRRKRARVWVKAPR